MSRMGFCPKFGAVYCILTKIIRIIVFDNQNAKVKIIESWMGFLSECTTVQSVDEMCRYMKGCVQQWCHGGRRTEGLESCDKMWQWGRKEKISLWYHIQLWQKKNMLILSKIVYKREYNHTENSFKNHIYYHVT